ncbi:DNA alkylation repair protein [Paenibacillus sp. NEAU-GSW1]|uniref:DNA alkylation repair protein n=1 Tax=Paenibacillus sp. NEAU-GSW1 TaxID=2682486 RepID=UPI0012E1CB85|nr:DNA alkylation repair protein [Paenibacillus sp. NEAU-GSW1]MUT66877.1 hypothetical protein [Paenibacillus sp. NEAU-GSW1]
MAEPLKDMYHEPFMREFAAKVHRVYPAFDEAAFVSATMDSTWEGLTLKERIRKIAVALGSYLPSRYGDALHVLYAIDEVCVGFPYLFFPDFVEVHGQADEHWEQSMTALERFTSKSSAEFAVRAFLLREPEKMMRRMEEWAEHPNEHVRRLASEGCRPRLPWGQSLPMFKRDPAPILPVLEKLKADPSLYVRKSVANNLNDIAKDHPQLVLETAKIWSGKHEYTDWIIRHGCRNLVRKADPDALSLFGYSQLDETEGKLFVSASISAAPNVLHIGESCELTYELVMREGDPLRIRIEYAVDFVKSNGQTSRKLFLLSDKTVNGGVRLRANRMHRFADLSTRRHYPGEHRIALTVNGVEAAHTIVVVKESLSTRRTY